MQEARITELSEEFQNKVQVGWQKSGLRCLSAEEESSSVAGNRRTIAASALTRLTRRCLFERMSCFNSTIQWHFNFLLGPRYCVTPLPYDRIKENLRLNEDKSPLQNNSSVLNSLRHFKMTCGYAAPVVTRARNQPPVSCTVSASVP